MIGFIERSSHYNRVQSAKLSTWLPYLTNRHGYWTMSCAADDRSRSLPLLQDLHAVFDCINIVTLPPRPEHITFCITGTAPLWLQSYVTDRSLPVRVGGETSIELRSLIHESHKAPFPARCCSHWLYVSPAANVYHRQGLAVLMASAAVGLRHVTSTLHQVTIL